MSILSWLARLFARPASIPAPGSDMLGAATLPKEGISVSAIGDPPKEAIVRSGVPDEVFALSEAFEAFRSAPYPDSGGVWTIGIGSTRDLAGKPVTASTPVVTRTQAEQMAARDLAHAADLLAQDFPGGLPARWWAVGVLLNNNLGRMSVWGATLLRLLHAQDWRGAAQQMSAYRNAGGKPSTGLRRRRWAEAAYALGMSPDLARQRAWVEIRTPDGWPPLPGRDG